MLVFTDNIRWLVIWSFICGAALCLLYDVIRAIRSFFDINTDIRRIKRGASYAPKLIFLIISDLAFCMISAVCFLVLAYYANGGVFRGLLLVCAALGFALCRMTVSRLFMFLLLRALKLVRIIFAFFIFILGKIAKPFFWLYHLTLGRIICIIKDRVKKKRERRNEEKMRSTGKEENVTYIEAAEDKGRKERIVIGRRAEKL